MSEYNRQKGKREAGGEFPLVSWWRRHRAWVAGLDRGQRIRYRLCVALGVIALLALIITLWLRAWIRLPDVPDPPDVVDPPPSGSTSQIQQPGQTEDTTFENAQLPEVTKSGRKDGYYTFLLCGKDQSSNSTDTMILITYDTQSKRIDAVSLLRDTMTNTSGKRGSQKRLNVVYARNQGSSKLSEKERVENGMTGLKKEVSKLTGIYPDFYVLVEWEAIGRLVEAIGGVYFDVPFDMDYDDDTQDLHIHQKAGYRLLNGRDAMEVVRFRKSNKNDPNKVVLGDTGRTQIQRDFLTAVVKKCLTPEILLKLPTLVDIFIDNVNTDLTVGNILAFAQLAVGMDVENGVEFVPMPYYNVMYTGDSLVCVKEKEMLELLNDGINPYLDDIKSSDLQLMYKKSGVFGVTNGTLVDPAVANVPAPKPAAADPETPGTTADPGTADDPGMTTDPGTTPGNIGDINPGDIFPDPSPDIRSGAVEGEARTAA